jgi:hypothetical protein
MAEGIDWDHIRRSAFAPSNTPSHWPSDVRPISTEGLTLLGIDRKNNLYWDGELIQTIPTRWKVAALLAFMLAALSLVANVFQIFGISIWSVVGFLHR